VIHNNIFQILTYKPDLNIIEYLYYYNGGGVAVGDINNDGLEDIFFTANQEIDRLYLNLGNFQFRDITKQANIDLSPSWSATTFDADNDGDLDIYVVSGGNDYKENEEIMMDRIYINDGKANFSRLPVALPSTNGSVVAAHDIDNDGYDDLFVGSRSIPGGYGLSPYSYIIKEYTRW